MQARHPTTQGHVDGKSQTKNSGSDDRYFDPARRGRALRCFRIDHECLRSSDTFINTLCLLTRQFCWIGYGAVMPKLWNETIDAHRQAVREATLNSTADLVAERGLASVTMSKIAEVTGIGRATLYKYFPDVNAILNAWHERHVMGHLHQLSDVRDKAGDTAQKDRKSVV